MTQPSSPFEYPSQPHVRRHSPPVFKDYRNYKPYLRDEFVFRCVYCLARELWRWNEQSLGVEHWQVKSLHPEERNNYSNLLYLCNDCNNMRGTRPLKKT